MRFLVELEARDKGSVTGVNIHKMEKEFGVHPRLMTGRDMKERYGGTQPAIHPEQEWKVHLLREMLTDLTERQEDGEKG